MGRRIRLFPLLGLYRLWSRSLSRSWSWSWSIGEREFDHDHDYDNDHESFDGRDRFQLPAMIGRRIRFLPHLAALSIVVLVVVVVVVDRGK
jgi:hypothetical protein